MRLPVLSLLLATLAMASVLSAAELAEPGSVAEAQQAQHALTAQLRGKDYTHVDAEHRQRIAGLQEAMAGLSEADGAPALAKARELTSDINAVLADAELDREVCHRERSTGSNRVTRVCRTKRQIAQQAEALRAHGPLRCATPNCAGG
jgi:hypothetical protein